MNSKCFIMGFSCIVLLGMMTGCVNSAVVYRDSYRELKSAPVAPMRIAGHYNVDIEIASSAPVSRAEDIVKDQLIGNRLARDLKRDAPFAFDKAGAANVPVKVFVKRDEKRRLGVLSTINDILSLCTLTIWPAYINTDYTYEVSVIFPDRIERRTYELSECGLASILPLGWIPVPAWADERHYCKPPQVVECIEPELLLKAVETTFPVK